MALSYDTVYQLDQIPDLEDAKVLASYEWEGVAYELRNHIDGWLLVVRSASSTATLYPTHVDGEFAFGRVIVDALLSSAGTRVGWNEQNRAGVTRDRQGTRWAVAWLQAGHPHFRDFDNWHSAHTALADTLEAMAAQPVYTGSNMEDEILQAYLRLAASNMRATVDRAHLGDTLREWQSHIQSDRRVADFAKQLDVERKFLYRVFNGTEWCPRYTAPATGTAE
jgi:DNA-binding NtrC family response regulator